jgi:hypothetical protein
MTWSSMRRAGRTLGRIHALLFSRSMTFMRLKRWLALALLCRGRVVIVEHRAEARLAVHGIT